MTPGRRRSYQMIFGDPLNWVRQRLGHASVESTLVYLHVLGELEMESRLALVPDSWETVGLAPGDLAAELTGHTDRPDGGDAGDAGVGLSVGPVGDRVWATSRAASGQL
jgi:hypothetical protein